MPTPEIDAAVARQTVDVVEQCLGEGYSPPGIFGAKGSAVQEAGRRLVAMGALRSISSIPSRLRAAERIGIVPDWSFYSMPKHVSAGRTPEPPPPVPEVPKDFRPEIMRRLRKAPASVEHLAEAISAPPHVIDDMIGSLKDAGVSLHKSGGRWHVMPPQSAHVGGPTFEFLSRPDNTFLFGATSDNHLGSKYSRLDVLNSLYDTFAGEGVDAVLNAGNWIDGEARFNTHDLLVHGMDAQMRYLAEHYPKRKGIKTYAVSGDDHEGWYAQREGIDVGRYAERVMRDSGRDDWIDVGYMEAHIRLINANTGATSTLALVHPGGGSAYAVSYSIQKIIESLDGGEKPAVGFYGHYHKLWAGNIRNVWVLQTGCTEDQTPFMRKKKIDAHVGGAVVKLTQDPDTGAITRFRPEIFRFFNRGYYDNRWSHHGSVIQADRGIA